jgi:radical SAM-linked protein
MNFHNIRVFFSKTGNARYISHLDLYRAFSRAIKRSGIPVWITEGFNPHIYMTFALPLALGIEGAEESVDLRVTRALPFDEVAQSLNSVMPAGIGIIRVAEPMRRANEIHRARYEIDADLDEYLSQPEIKITKKTKKNVQVIDVKPLLEWDDGIMLLPAGGELNINPWNVLSEFRSSVGLVRRVAILCKDTGLFM